ncbi:MAG: histidine phosphatase family protein [Candidatus Solibacter usitatus]|nr:histidine phosphatase family protein [Candidatus Solibacter usitatus]
MSTIYFFRHGQAGQRDDYDRLSELGREQARLLGEHVAGVGERFDLALIGGLRRQAETAELALERMHAAGLGPPEARVDRRWSEFDLDAVYAEIAPPMAAEDEEFRLEYEEVRHLVRCGDGQIHRRWTPADSKVVKAWIAGRYEMSGESWREFVARVKEAGREFGALPAEARVAVFTSATPAAIWVAAAFGSEQPRHVMGLAGAAINANITALRWRDGEPQLLSFNGVPHLGEARLRTFR